MTQLQTQDKRLEVKPAAILNDEKVPHLPLGLEAWQRREVPLPRGPLGEIPPYTPMNTSLSFHTGATLNAVALTLDPGLCFPSRQLLSFYSCPGSGFNGFS